jgi:hypothetical protein
VQLIQSSDSLSNELIVAVSCFIYSTQFTMATYSPTLSLPIPVAVMNDNNKNKSNCATSMYPLGYIHTISRLRSIVTHPLGLALTAVFHDQVLPYHYQLYPSFLTDIDLSSTSSSRFVPDRIFGEAIKLWKNTADGPEFVHHLVQQLRSSKYIANSRCLLVEGTQTLPPRYNNESSNPPTQVSGQFDILLCEPVNDWQSVVAAMNIGTNTYHDGCHHSEKSHENWWNKIDEGITFLDLHHLSNHTQLQQLCFSKPMLLVNITIDYHKYNNTTVVRMGCFLCTKKKANHVDFRMSLLWRDEITCTTFNDYNHANAITPISKAFGMILHASMLCWKYRDMQPYVDHEYLSPCCSLYGNKVRFNYIF